MRLSLEYQSEYIQYIESTLNKSIIRDELYQYLECDTGQIVAVSKLNDNNYISTKVYTRVFNIYEYEQNKFFTLMLRTRTRMDVIEDDDSCDIYHVLFDAEDLDYRYQGQNGGYPGYLYLEDLIDKLQKDSFYKLDLHTTYQILATRLSKFHAKNYIMEKFSTKVQELTNKSNTIELIYYLVHNAATLSIFDLTDDNEAYKVIDELDFSYIGGMKDIGRTIRVHFLNFNQL